jgi:3-dehydroquinate dehydratase-1
MKKVSVGTVVIGEAPVMICTVLEGDPDSIVKGVEKSRTAGADLVEIRVDKLPHNEDVKKVLSFIDFPHIVSCRSKDGLGFFEGTEEEKAERLLSALQVGVDIIDVELTMTSPWRTKIMEEAHARKIPVLLGYENMAEIPPLDVLIEKATEIQQIGPDIAKLAVKARNYEDMLTALHLTLACNEIFDIPFAIIAVGPHGSASRPLACVLGSSMTYCTTKKREEAPPGQLSIEDTRKIIEILQ